MKTLICIISIVCTVFTSNAHEFFFAFAEMEYNDVSRKFEVTITATTHDIEKLYEKKMNLNIDLNHYDEKSITTSHITHYFDKHFRIQTEDKACVLHLIGFESSLNGTTHFYFESEAVDITPSIRVKFDFLMDEYEQQQNKITLYFRDKSYTVDFLRNEIEKTIRLI